MEPFEPSEKRLSGGSVNARARDELLPPYRKDSGFFEYDPNQTQAQDHEAQDSNPQMAKIKRTQEAINEVKDQLQENIEAIHVRGERLDIMQQKTDNLTIQSRAFKSQATVVRRKMWWKNLKWTLCLVFFVIILIAGAVGGSVKGHQIYEEHQTIVETKTAVPSSAINATASVSA